MAANKDLETQITQLQEKLNKIVFNTLIFKDLETQITQLQERISKMSSSNMQLRDDVVELKSHYINLIDGLNQRFEVLENRFQKRTA